MFYYIKFGLFSKEKNYIPDYFKQNGKKVVLYVGRLVEIKGIKYLIEAIEGLDVKLIIVYSETWEWRTTSNRDPQGRRERRKISWEGRNDGGSAHYLVCGID